MLGLKKSTFYRWRNIKSYSVKPATAKEGTMPGFSYTFDGKKISDLIIQKHIVQILNDEIGQHYGYKKVTAVLRRANNIKISKKKVFRLMSSMNLIKKKSVSRGYSKRICRNHSIKSSNTLWELDTKYIYIAGTKQIAYLASIIDVFDRSIVSYELSLSPNAESAKKAVIKALFNRSIKSDEDSLTIRTDNGSQFIAYEFEKLCLTKNIIHERIPAHSPNYNAHIESYHRYLQDECLSGKLFNNIDEAEDVIGNYVLGYNTKRIHSSINYRTPQEFYELKNDEFKNKLTVSL